ncbi:MAG: VWA domain-containing protein [Bacteroidales bacterium]|nr:VWA domain-containing protein [Bacteroidales bacterium]
MKTMNFKNTVALNLKRIAALMIFSFLTSVTFSQDIADKDKTLSPYFMVYSDDVSTDRLPLKSTSATVNITGVIADVTVKQVYKNEGKKALEAVYTFPASINAAVYAMEMTIGSRKIVAKIEEKNKAREEYETAKTEGRRASLLEQDRPNVFQMNVANIMPGDVVSICLKYTELLVPDGGTYKFVYPTVVGPRYSNQATSSSDPANSFINTPYQNQGEKPGYSFDMQLNLSMGMPIQKIVCNTHKVNTRYPQLSQAQVNLDKSEAAGGNRDFVLEYQLRGEQIESGLMLYEHEDENFFLLMVQPPKQIVKEEIPPREYIFIVDVSGSMCGFPLTVTKSLLRDLVVNLRPADRFNILVFAGSSGWLSETSVPATIENVEKAIYFMDNQGGGGATELLPALKKALEFPRSSESLSRSFVVITDGYIAVEKEAFDLIRNNCDQANLFAFGIGSSVNRYLIEGMANAGLGEPFIALNEKSASEEAVKFRNYISNPVLTRVKKSFSGFEAYDVQPLSVPDVLAERPVIIFGKYRGKAAGNITIKGYTGTKSYKKTFNAGEFKPSGNHAAIRYLWARKKIQLLDDYTNLGYNNTNHVEEITGLGLKYNLMTAYTSFLAIEKDVVANDGETELVKQPLPMPEGVPNSAIGFDMEVDLETVSFALHREIVLLTGVQEGSKKKLTSYIEENLPGLLISCLGMSEVIPQEIEISVDAKGKIVKIVLKGTGISGELEKCIKKTIATLDFSKIYAGSEFKFKVIF